jgi:hypothetical protein
MSATLGAPDQEQLVNAWARYVGSLPETDTAGFLSGIGALVLLPGDVRTRVEALPGRPVPAKSQLLRGVDPAERVLAFAWRSAGMSVSQIRNLFHQGHLSDLETCSQVLNHASGVREANEDGEESESDKETPLEAIRRLAQGIIDEVLRADLPGPAGAAFAEYAHAILKSVDLFHLTGPEGVTREYERFLGGLILDPTLQKVMQARSGIRDRVKEMASYIAVLGAAVTVPLDFAVKASEVYAALAPLIGT